MSKLKKHIKNKINDSINVEDNYSLIENKINFNNIILNIKTPTSYVKRKFRLTYFTLAISFTIIIGLSLIFLQNSKNIDKNTEINLEEIMLSKSKVVEKETLQEFKLRMKENDYILDPNYEEKLKNLLLNFSSTIISKEENEVFSPLSLYYSLSMLSEITSGTSQEEILNVLGLSLLDNRKNISILNDYLCMDTGINKFLIKNSLWFNDGNKFNQNTLDLVSQNYYTDIFKTSFNDKESINAMIKWIEDASSKKLGDLKDIGSTDAIFKLFNIQDFYGLWGLEFLKTEMDFTLKNNEIIKTNSIAYDFNRINYLDNNTFTSSGINLDNGFEIVFILPKDNFSPLDILNNSSLLNEAINYKNANTLADVHYKIPKFSYENSHKLIEPLKQLGIKEVFTNNANFDNFYDGTAFISEINQSNVIALDEYGVSASTVTTTTGGTSPMPIDQIYMYLNRPFAYAIVKNGIIVYAGSVYNPSIYIQEKFLTRVYVDNISKSVRLPYMGTYYSKEDKFYFEMLDNNTLKISSYDDVNKISHTLGSGMWNYNKKTNTLEFSFENQTMKFKVERGKLSLIDNPNYVLYLDCQDYK